MTQTRFGVASTNGLTMWEEPTLPWIDELIPEARAEEFTPVPVPTQAGPAAQLVISRGSHAGTALALTAPETTIGRHRECDIVFDDVTVSRKHAEIRRHGDRYTITDAGSLNGTYLNRRPIEFAELSEGDEVWVGKVRFIFRTNGARPES